MTKLQLLIILLGLLLTACAPLPTEVERQPSTAFYDSQETSLGRLFAPELTNHPGESGFIVLDTGKQAFVQRAMLADTAERSIDAQYYIWNSDTTGKLMAQRMLRAADRGVRVRILLDDFNVGDRDPQLLALNAHPNIEIRIYNPFSEDARSGLRKQLVFVADFGRLNRRMHNKTYVVDGSAAIVGGRNIGDEYFDASHELNFRDRDLMAIGPIVVRVSENFDAYWNSNWTYPIDVVVSREITAEKIKALHDNLHAFAASPTNLPYQPPREPPAIRVQFTDLLQDFVWAEATLVYDPPGKRGDTFRLAPQDRVAWKLFNLAQQSKEEILIESAYFIPGDLLLDLLGRLHTQDVSLRALTNSLASNDVLMNHAGYTRRRRAIVEQGVELHELRPDAASCWQLVAQSQLCDDALFGLHSKSAVFDRSIVFVGSFNVNMRSAFLNSETALIVYSPELARQIATAIEQNLEPENSWHVILNNQDTLEWVTRINGAETRNFREPDTGFWQRFKSGFISLFPLERYY